MSAYELRIYTVAAGEMPVLHGIFRDLVLPMLPDYSIASVGYWSTPDQRTLYYIVRHASVAAITGNWDRFHADPRWQPGLAERQHGRTVVENTQSVPPLGIEGLPPLSTGL